MVFDMDNKEFENVEKWVKMLEDAEKNELFNDPWFHLIRIGMFDYPDLIKY